MVPDEFKFETFVEAQGTAMQEYLSSVVAKLSKTDKAHRAIQDKIESIYRQYPHVMGMFDTEKAVALTEQECAAAIEVVGLQNQLVELEMQSVYFRGCYDSVGYLKKAGPGGGAHRRGKRPFKRLRAGAVHPNLRGAGPG